jgi:predicted DNA-binding protein YlxM (UPF0122 family)
MGGAFVNLDVESGVRYSWLFSFYGPLLTEKQRDVARLRFEEDLSYSEIAEAQGITRQGVYDALHRVERQLNAFEEKLGLLHQYLSMRLALQDTLKAIEDGVDSAQVAQKLRALLEREETDGGI